MHPKLNLPSFNIRTQDQQIWDRLRKKYVPNDPEEWVRQNFIYYLIEHLGYPEGLMASEYTVNYNKMKKRCDIVVMNRELQAVVIVECKAPHIRLTEDTFYQIARYNHVLKAPLLILTNGLQHFCALVKTDGTISYLQEIPNKKALESFTD